MLEGTRPRTGTTVYDFQVEAYERTIEPVLRSKQITMRGAVQGTGFRCFVHRLAHEHGLTGWVLSYSGGAAIEVEGPPAALDAFIHNLTFQSLFSPFITSMDIIDDAPIGYTCFDIHRSVVEEE